MEKNTFFVLQVKTYTHTDRSSYFPLNSLILNGYEDLSA